MTIYNSSSDTSKITEGGSGVTVGIGELVQTKWRVQPAHPMPQI